MSRTIIIHEQYTTGKIQKRNYYERQGGWSSTAKRPPGISIFSDTEVQKIV